MLLPKVALLFDALLVAASGCASSSSGGSNTGASTPCDPLTPPSVTLGTLLGVGKDAQGTLYVADVAPGTGSPDGQDRVFVSSGKTLVRQDVGGTGQMGGPPNASYDLSFQPAFADAAAARSLYIEQSGGTVTGMSLGPGGTKGFGPDAGSETLTVLDAKALDGFALQNLPNVAQTVADVSDGSALVVVQPMAPYGTSASRLFYGKPGQMLERTITAYNTDCCEVIIGFTVGSASYTATLTFNLDPDAGSTGPTGATLSTGSRMLSMTLRSPTPQALGGFAFTCLAH